ncbi:Hypothetical protein NTJ_00981 [Nesidiocoris tenuis]|uniref:Uncharacterized protein n=1 Tax=Nesidiocoris tenuis TaxID=355587 RepID=A0ABN7A7N8_9HEMI|nr:Hypothetical protein NTJ_00981 [Nesidiocoris tenuis]
MRPTTLAQLLSLCALAQAMSTSLMADIKEAHLQSPMKSNKVKRAQEFIMFGNQQNRASSSFGNPKSEKRATQLDDNRLNEEEEPVRTYSPAEEDRSMESNQLANAETADRSAYPHYLRDLYYSLLLRNMDVGQNVPRESGYMDLPLYSMVEDRPKRDTNAKVQKSSSKSKPTSLTKEKPSQQSNKKGDRTKRDSLSDLVTMIKYIEAEKAANREYAEPRNYLKYYADESAPREDINDLLGGSNWNDEGGAWYDMDQVAAGPKSGSYYLPRPHNKRFMVSKRRYDDSPLYGQDPYFNLFDGVQARRRYFI